MMQVIVLQAEVTYRFGLLIVFLQWLATIVAGYVVALLLGVVLSKVGVALQPPPPDPQAQRQPLPRRQDRSQAKDQPQDEGQHVTLQMIQHHLEEKSHSTTEYLKGATESLKDYAETHMEEFKQDVAPAVEHLPGPVRNFLDNKGGWWWILGGLTLFALLWMRSVMRRLLTAASRPKKKKTKRKMKKVTANLREDLAELGEALTEAGEEQLTINKIPARVRLVVLSGQSASTGHLSEDMAERVLDWIQPGLAEATADDYPRIRIWPIHPTADAFARAMEMNVPIPGTRDSKSRWVLVSGQVRMGKAIVNVGLGLYTVKPTNLRYQVIKGEKWRGLIGIHHGELVGAD
jgi:hypothetical protein